MFFLTPGTDPCSGLAGREGCAPSPHPTALSSLLPRWGPAAHRHEDQPLQSPAGSPAGAPAGTQQQDPARWQRQRWPSRQLPAVCHAGVSQRWAAALLRRADARHAEVRGGWRDGTGRDGALPCVGLSAPSPAATCKPCGHLKGRCGGVLCEGLPQCTCN